jgi:hypothetical protein
MASLSMHHACGRRERETLFTTNNGQKHEHANILQITCTGPGSGYIYTSLSLLPPLSFTVRASCAAAAKHLWDPPVSSPFTAFNFDSLSRYSPRIPVNGTSASTTTGQKSKTPILNSQSHLILKRFPKCKARKKERKKERKICMFTNSPKKKREPNWGREGFFLSELCG